MNWTNKILMLICMRNSISIRHNRHICILSTLRFIFSALYLIPVHYPQAHRPSASMIRSETVWFECFQKNSYSSRWWIRFLQLLQLLDSASVSHSDGNLLTMKDQHSAPPFLFVYLAHGPCFIKNLSQKAFGFFRFIVKIKHSGNNLYLFSKTKLMSS